jgi:hypothetical protein
VLSFDPLEDGFDHDVRLGHDVHVRGGDDPAERGLDVLLGDLALGGEPSEGLLYGRGAAAERRFVDVPHRDMPAGLCRDLGDAGTHQTGADDRESTRHVYLSFSGCEFPVQPYRERLNEGSAPRSVQVRGKRRGTPPDYAHACRL